MHFGITTPSGNANTLIQSATAIATESFSLGVAKDQVFGKQDQAGFVFSQPLRAVSGSANLSVPVARDYFGNISYTSATASLAADGRELDLQGFYKTPVAEGASLNLGAMLRLQPMTEHFCSRDVTCVRERAGTPGPAVVDPQVRRGQHGRLAARSPASGSGVPRELRWLEGSRQLLCDFMGSRVCLDIPAGPRGRPAVLRAGRWSARKT